MVKDGLGGLPAYYLRLCVNKKEPSIHMKWLLLDGAAGWPAVNAGCDSKFGSGARLCNAKEVYQGGGAARSPSFMLSSRL